MLTDVLLFTITTVFLVSKTKWISPPIEPLSYPYAYQAAGHYNSTIFLIGGYNGFGSNHIVVEYDTLKNTFNSTNYTLDRDVYGFAHFYTQINDKIYMTDWRENHLCVYDMKTRVFTSIWQNIIFPESASQSGGGYACLASTANYIFIVGGDAGNPGAKKIFQILNISNYSWILSPPDMNVPRYLLSCIVHPSTDMLYAIGGTAHVFPADPYHDTIELISVSEENLNNIQMQNWSYNAHNLINKATASMRSVIYQDTIWVIGGYDNNYVYSNTFQIINTSNGYVSFGGTLNYSATGAAVIDFNGTVYVFGGQINQWQYSNQYQYYLSLVETTDNPTTSIPTTSMPTTAFPTTSFPTTSFPTTSLPTTATPTSNYATTGSSTSAASTVISLATIGPTSSPTEWTTTEASTPNAITTGNADNNTSTTTISNPTTSMPTTSIPTTSIPTTSPPTSSSTEWTTTEASTPNVIITGNAVNNTSPITTSTIISTTKQTISPTSTPTENGEIKMYGIAITLSFEYEIDKDDTKLLKQIIIDIMNDTIIMHNITIGDCIDSEPLFTADSLNTENNTFINATTVICDNPSQIMLLISFKTNFYRDFINKTNKIGLTIKLNEGNFNISGNTIYKKAGTLTPILLVTKATISNKNNDDATMRILIGIGCTIFVCILVICLFSFYKIKKINKEIELNETTIGLNIISQRMDSNNTIDNDDEYTISTPKGNNFNFSTKNIEKKLMMKEWLTNTVELEEYYDVFIENGFESIGFIKEIGDKAELTAIGIMMIGHQTRIMAAINELKKEGNDNNKEEEDGTQEGVQQNITNNATNYDIENIHNYPTPINNDDEFEILDDNQTNGDIDLC